MNKILPPKPDLLASDISDIEDWDSESEAGIEEAAKVLDSLCQINSSIEPATSNNNESTLINTTLTEPTIDPTLAVVGKTSLKVDIPRIRAPSPPRVNRVDAEPSPDSTKPTSTPTATREKWLSKATPHNIETAITQGRCKVCHWQANELHRTKLHTRQHYTLHMCKCRLISPSRDTIYRHQHQGRCPLQQTNIFKVDKETYGEFCHFIGWTDPPTFGRCVPTRQGPKRVDNSSKQAITTPIPTLKLRTGYKIPKKSTTPVDREEGELDSSDDTTPPPMIASQISRPKRSRSESPATELRRAIELLEEADILEQKAKTLREKAKVIRQRYDNKRRNESPKPIMARGV